MPPTTSTASSACSIQPIQSTAPPVASFGEGKIVGLDALAAKVKKSGRFGMHLYVQMSRRMEADTPWIVHTFRIRNWVTRPWIKGFKKHPILHSEWQYLGVDRH